MQVSYPASPGGPLPAETVTTGYSGPLDLPSALSGSVSYALNTTYTAYNQVGQEEIGVKPASAAYLTDTYDAHTGALTDSQLTHPSVSSTPIDDTSFCYDSANNPIHQTEKRQGTVTETQCFGYDTLDRLTQAWTENATAGACATDSSGKPSGNGANVSSGIGSPYWTTWSFDPLGLRTSETDHGLSGAADATTSYSYSYNGNGTVQPHALAATSTTGSSTTATTAYAYDQAGNTTQRASTTGGSTSSQTLGWNDLGKLSTVTTASGGTSYIYDADGNLLLQKDTATATNTLYLPGEQFSYDTATGAVTGTRFLTLPGGGEVVRTSGSDYTFETADQHGTFALAIDPTFTTATWRQQTPYGVPRGTVPVSWPDNHGFLDKVQDATTGLTHVGARWYDPAIGRFTSLDPKRHDSSSQEQNRYTYAADNPVSGSDPTGLSDCWGIECNSGPAPDPGNSCWGIECNSGPAPDPGNSCWGIECNSGPAPNSCWGIECSSGPAPCWGIECNSGDHGGAPLPVKIPVKVPDEVIASPQGAQKGWWHDQLESRVGTEAGVQWTLAYCELYPGDKHWCGPSDLQALIDLAGHFGITINGCFIHCVDVTVTGDGHLLFGGTGGFDLVSRDKSFGEYFGGTLQYSSVKIREQSWGGHVCYAEEIGACGGIGKTEEGGAYWSAGPAAGAGIGVQGKLGECDWGIFEGDFHCRYPGS
jgi:RHS repeat-associated protein